MHSYAMLFYKKSHRIKLLFIPLPILLLVKKKKKSRIQENRKFCLIHLLFFMSYFLLTQHVS